MPQFTAESSLNSAGSYQEAAEWSPADGGNGQRVIPQDGCPRGYWCCRTLFGGRRCVRCSIRNPFTGRCLIPQVVQCARVGGIPANCG